MSDLLALVTSLRLDVERLSARVDDFDRRQPTTDLDAPIVGMRLVAQAIGTKSVRTLRAWVADIELAERYRMAVLLRRTPSGQWMTTRRWVAQWRQAIQSNPWEVQVASPRHARRVAR